MKKVSAVKIKTKTLRLDQVSKSLNFLNSNQVHPKIGKFLSLNQTLMGILVYNNGINVNYQA